RTYPEGFGNLPLHADARLPQSRSADGGIDQLQGLRLARRGQHIDRRDRGKESRIDQEVRLLRDAVEPQRGQRHVLVDTVEEETGAGPNDRPGGTIRFSIDSPSQADAWRERGVVGNVGLNFVSNSV